MESLSKGYQRWLIAAVVVLVGSLFLLAADGTMAFVSYADRPMPLWLLLVGVVAALGVALGFASMFGLMLVATLRSRREARRVQFMPTNWKATDAVVANSIESHTKAGNVYSVVFTYVVDGSYYGGTFTTMQRYADGETFAIQYDPENPERNDVVRRDRIRNWLYALFFVGLAVMAVYLFLQPKSK